MSALCALGWHIAVHPAANAQDGTGRRLFAAREAGEDEFAESGPTGKKTSAQIAHTGNTPKAIHNSTEDPGSVANSDSSSTKRYSFETYPPVEAKIQQALTERAELIYRDTPLNQVVQDLAERYKIAIVLDPVGFEQVGIDSSSEGITCDLSNMRLQSGLNHLLDQYRLTAIIKDEALLITSRERACMLAQPRVYWLDETWHMSTDELVVAITSSIEPETWSASGGPSSIVGIHNTLVIRTSDVLHVQINRLLAQIDRIHQ